MSSNLVIEFSEETESLTKAGMVEYFEPVSRAEDVNYYEGNVPPAELAAAVEQGMEQQVEQAVSPAGDRLPGSDYVIEFKEEQEPEKQTDWAKDRDVKKFMNYIVSHYPDNIPKHDGTSIVGCERAYNFLNRLNKEISEAIRMDTGDDLEADTLENLRVNMMKDMILLKNRIGDLKERVRNHGKKAGEEGSEIVKEGTTAIVQTVATPFQRAIVGILINSVVSAGKPFEDVYEFLKEKYAFDDRDELSIMQLAMDSGFPIFKDRGLIGESKKNEEGSGYGVDYLKNYLS